MAAYQGAGGGLTALDQFIAKVFTGPRVTWAALMVAGAVSVALLHFGFGPDSQSPLGNYAVLGAWILLVIGGSFLVVMIGFDCVSALKNRPAKPKHEAYRPRLLDAPEPTRAMIAFFAIRNEDSAWFMGDYPGTFAFRSLGFGRLATTQHGACLIEIDTSLSVWLQQELSVVTELNVSDEAQKRLIESLDRAQLAINSLHA